MFMRFFPNDVREKHFFDLCSVSPEFGQNWILFGASLAILWKTKKFITQPQHRGGPLAPGVIHHVPVKLERNQLARRRGRSPTGTPTRRVPAPEMKGGERVASMGLDWCFLGLGF